jgi:hypothetical protein
VAEWKFEEVSGSTANDTSGNGNNGTLYNTVSRTTGKIGKAVYFDGATTTNGDSFIRLPNAAFNSQTQGSICFWMNAGVNDYKIPFSADDGIHYIVFDYSNTDQELDFDTWNGSSEPLGFIIAGITPNAWHHICVVMSSTGSSAYVDGVKKSVSYYAGNASTTYWFNNLTGPGTVGYAIGCRTNATDANDCSDATSMYKGYIDDFRIYNYALTPQQVIWEYNRL